MSIQNFALFDEILFKSWLDQEKVGDIRSDFEKYGITRVSYICSWTIVWWSSIPDGQIEILHDPLNTLDSVIRSVHWLLDVGAAREWILEEYELLPYELHLGRWRLLLRPCDSELIDEAAQPLWIDIAILPLLGIATLLFVDKYGIGWLSYSLQWIYQSAFAWVWQNWEWNQCLFVVEVEYFEDGVLVAGPEIETRADGEIVLLQSYPWFSCLSHALGFGWRRPPPWPFGRVGQVLFAQHLGFLSYDGM